MADIHQTGSITTLHLLGDKGTEKIERELAKYSKYIKTTVLIPATYEDYTKPPMKNIMETLRGVDYIHQVLIVLGKATEEDFKRVKSEIREYPYRITVLWLEHPQVKELIAELEDAGLYVGPDGKGRAVWFGFGLLLGQKEADIIALHDSDIITYSRTLLSRLIYPVMNPNIDFEFSKGFYARFSNKIHGRVTRLFVIPLIRALKLIVGDHPFLTYLDSFRYPLAGEFALKADLARMIRIPGDWGLEVGILSEVYRNVAIKRIIQVELCERYDHKHQELSREDPNRGLHKMATDIAVNLLRNLAARGVIVNEGRLLTLRTTYLRIAEDMIARFHADAMINGLLYDRNEEELAVETFDSALKIACDQFLEDPLAIPLTPNWIRITSVFPDYLDRLMSAVVESNK